LPLPIIGLVAFILWRSSAFGIGGPRAQLTLNVLGVVAAFAGEALRFYTLGLVPEGTSGQRYVLEAAVLNVRGPYAHVRNPLYLGNFVICVGLLLVSQNAPAFALGIAFFFAQYFFIVRAEESFLREKYGEHFGQYASRVPRWIPRLRPAFSGSLRAQFDLARALKKEHNPFTAWSSGMLGLLAWQQYARGTLRFGALMLFASMEALILASFLAIKGYKHGWFLGRR
jgi:protein-S-isoprenylcysteine O-methyltransferase Ste14